MMNFSMDYATKKHASKIQNEIQVH